MRSWNVVFGGNMLDEMCATVVTGMVTRLSALLADSLLLETQTPGNSVVPMVVTILSQTRGAQHSQSISWSTTAVTLPCLETLLADLLGSRRASQGCVFGASATSDSSAIITSRLTAIFAQPCLNASLVGSFVGYVVSSLTRIGANAGVKGAFT